MTITWDNKSFTMFEVEGTYWMTFPTGQKAPLGINITKDKAIDRFFHMSYAFVYRTVGRILN
jgi:hypothetical protein